MTRVSRLVALCILLLAAPATQVASQTAGHAGQLNFDILFGDNPDGEIPTQLTWSPDGSRLSYLWDDGEGEGLWILDIATGEARLRLRADDPTIDAHQWAPGGEAILLEFEDSARLLKLQGADDPRELPTGGGEVEDPKFSPDGERLTFVSDADLFLLELGTGELAELTTGGTPGELLHGVTDWVYWEELWNRDSTGYWWSPDGSRIAYYQFDETPVAEYPLVNYLSTYPEVEWQRYPKSGQALPLVRVGALDPATGETVWMQTAAADDHYFARVYWRPDSQRLVILQLNREQTRLELLSCRPATGECTPWMSETWPTWLNLHDDFHWTEDGGFLWSSEKSGFRALYLHDRDGHEVRRLTPEGWAVGSVRAFNAAAGWVLYDAYSTAPLGAIHRTIFKQDLAGGLPIELTADPATHRATASDASGHWVHSRSRADSPRRIAVRDLAGTERATLPSREPAGYDAVNLPAWQFITVPGPEGSTLPASLLLPADFDPERRYPAIMYHYGGPSSQVVNDVWGRRGRGLWHKMMAERGYVVFSLDNGASRFFGKHGEDRAHRSFGPLNLAAQLAGVDYLSGLGYVDPERIGLWGWSGGGYHTLYALTHAPGVWRAGMAGAPVSDWKFYDAIWTERYMDHPDDNPEGYATASALDAASQLEDHLLIVHGTADDNVHLQNTLAMTAKLIEAGTPFEEAIHPRQKHGFRGDDSRHFYERMTRFFDRYLAGTEEPPTVSAPPLGAAH